MSDEVQEQLFELPEPEVMQVGDDFYVLKWVKGYWRKTKVKNMEGINGA